MDLDIRFISAHLEIDAWIIVRFKILLESRNLMDSLFV